MRTQELKGLFGKKYDIVCNMTRPVIYKTHIYRNDCNCCWATLQNRHLLCGWAKLENGDIVSVLQHCNWIENLCIVIHILLWVCRAPHNRKKREHFAVLRVATVFVNLFLYFLGGGGVTSAFYGWSLLNKNIFSCKQILASVKTRVIRLFCEKKRPNVTQLIFIKSIQNVFSKKVAS
jgi:hypothetical protein